MPGRFAVLRRACLKPWPGAFQGSIQSRLRGRARKNHTHWSYGAAGRTGCPQYPMRLPTLWLPPGSYRAAVRTGCPQHPMRQPTLWLASGPYGAANALAAPRTLLGGGPRPGPQDHTGGRTLRLPARSYRAALSLPGGPRVRWGAGRSGWPRTLRRPPLWLARAAAHAPAAPRVRPGRGRSGGPPGSYAADALGAPMTIGAAHVVAAPRILPGRGRSGCPQDPTGRRTPGLAEDRRGRRAGWPEEQMGRRTLWLRPGPYRGAATSGRPQDPGMRNGTQTRAKAPGTGAGNTETCQAGSRFLGAPV